MSGSGQRLSQNINKQPMRKKNYTQDIQYLSKKLPELHADLYRLVSPKQFYQACDTALKQIEQEDFDETNFPLILLQIFSKIKDSHTSVRRNISRTPFYFEYVNDGYYAIVVPVRYKQLLGAKVESINGLSLEKFSSDVDKFLIYDNPEAHKIETLSALTDRSLIKAASGDPSTKDSVMYKFKLYNQGRVEEVILEKEDYESQQTSIFWIDGNEYMREKGNYSCKPLGDTLYIRYRSCEEDIQYPISKFIANISVQLNLRPKKLIIDIRDNRGGDSSVINPLIDALHLYLGSNPSTVFCLIDRYCYSSAILNCFHIKERLNATLVGTAAGQGYNHFGDVGIFALPATGEEIQYSKKYFKITDDESRSVIPDIVVEPTIEDYMGGKDRILDYCLHN